MRSKKRRTQPEHHVEKADDNSRPKRKRDISIGEELMAYDRERQKTSQLHAGDEDDELIKYLERKLSIKSSQDSEAVFKSVADEEFGGDTELFDLVESVLKDEPTRREGRAESADESETEASEGVEAEEEGEEDEDLEESTSMNKPKRAKGPTSSETPAQAWRPRHQQEREKFDISERYRQIIVRGFNRVGEGNLQITGDSMVKDLQAIKDEVQLKLIGSSSATAEVSQLVDKISTACAEEATLNLKSKAALALLGPQAGLICILGSRFSPKVLFRYLFMIVNNLSEALQKYEQDSQNDHDDDGFTSVKDLARHCAHSLSLLAYFDCLDIDFLIDVCRLIGLTEGDHSDPFRLELLALIFRICSVELKRNYEPQFMELDAIIQGVISKCENSSLKSSKSMHVEWIRHELANVGKHRKAPMYEKLKALKTILGKYPKGMFQIMDSTALMKNILEKNFDKAFSSLRTGEADASAASAADNSQDLKETQEDRQLRQLAKKASIRAPLQQDVFIALAKSSDTLDAITNVLKCVKSPHNIEAALAVILHCMLQEKTYNPFYAAVTNGLCSLPDLSWRKKFIKGTRRGLHLLTSNDDTFNGDTGKLKKSKLKIYINEITESLGDKDSAQLLAKNIFRH